MSKVLPLLCRYYIIYPFELFVLVLIDISE